MSKQAKKSRNAKEKIVFACLWLFLLLPNILGLFLAEDLLTSGQRCLYFIGAIALYTFGLTIFRRRTFLYIASAGLLFEGVEIVHLIINQATTSMLFIFTIIKSEKGEFFELLSMYWFGVLIFFAIIGVYYYLAHKYIRDRWIGRQSHRIIVGVLIGVFFILSAVMLNTRPKFRNIFNTQAKDERTAAWVGVEKICPINHLLGLYHIARLGYDIRSDAAMVEGFTFGVPEAANDPNTVVLFLIGETSRYDHWSINGYERETSPRLQQRADHLVSFDNCYSVANLTTVSVPFILSRATPAHMDIYTKERSVVEAFQEAGYRTSWIADQSFNNHFLLRIAATCDNSVYINDNGKNLFTDSLLLIPLAEELAHGGRQMIVLHSLGCHFKYSERYPNTFQVWSPDMKGFDIWSTLRSVDDDVDGMAPSNNLAVINNLRTILVNSYDNALLFSDFFIDAVIAELEASRRPVVLVYVGDHGENLFDDERNMFLHGTFAGSEYEYHVPLFVWTSTAYEQEHPTEVQALKDNKAKYFTTMNIFHSLLNLGSIDYNKYDPNHSFSSPQMVSDSILYGLDANLQMMELPVVATH